MRSPRSVSLSLLVAMFVFSAIGCGAAPPRICRSSASCAEGDACVTGQCTSATNPSPLSPSNRRIVLEPESVAFVSSGGTDGARPPAVPLGASIGDHARILLRFPKGTWSRESIVKAYLVLDRVKGAQAGPDDVLVNVMRITEPWSASAAAGTSWASPPKGESIVGAEANISARGTVPIRIDVTSYAVELAKKDARAWGLRVEANGGGYGVPIATGYGGGAGPRLEVFLQ